MSIPLITPDWPPIPGVHGASTTRCGGVSEGQYSSLNVGDHVGDKMAHVSANRNRLSQQLGLLPEAVQWLSQIHGTEVCVVSRPVRDMIADAAFTTQRQLACAVMTADCLPVLLASRDGKQIGAAHGGWRGLLQGVLEATLAHFGSGSEVQAWLGPAIGPAAFEVGPEVRAAFIDRCPDSTDCFNMGSGEKWFADIYQLARRILQRAGVTHIHGGNFCTVSDSRRFFSYRRDGVTGRMVTLIWKS